MKWLEIGRKTRAPGLTAPCPRYGPSRTGLMDGHCLLQAEFLLAEAADALLSYASAYEVIQKSPAVIAGLSFGGWPSAY